MFPKDQAPTLEEPPVVRRLAILNDYVRIPYANGSSFASQFLYREFKRRGAQVTVVGPADPSAEPEELPPGSVCIRSLPFRSHPGVYFTLPDARAQEQLRDADADLMLAQTGSGLINIGVWLRRAARVPLVCVNTIHLPSVYDVLLPSWLHGRRWAHKVFERWIIPWAERMAAELYNDGDGLVVLSQGLKRYWRERGVKVPIFVIPRSVEPKVFDQGPLENPFPAQCVKGERLLMVCRHTREKNVRRMLELFAKEIVPRMPNATLTLVGDGPDHDEFKEVARQNGVSEKCIFPGEVSLLDVPSWYQHADLFVYSSLSETYGQVVSEALWCGLPVVAFHDDKGVADQIKHGEDGFLVRPEKPSSDAEFASAVLGLLQDDERRRTFGECASRNTRLRADPNVCIQRYEEAAAQVMSEMRSADVPTGWFRRSLPLARMTFLTLLVTGLGCFRAPAQLNRHGRKPPVWDLPESDTRTCD